MNPVMCKRKRITTGSHPELEKALKVYINDVSQYLRYESPFRDSIVREKAFHIQDTMVSRLTARAALINDVERKDKRFSMQGTCKIFVQATSGTHATLGAMDLQAAREP